MTANSSGGYRFGEFELQPEERRLLASGTALRVGRNAFDVLVVLVERSGHLVTKDQLFERVWPKLVVEENTLQSHVSALRKILGPAAIATVSGRGYRFTLEVARVEAAPAVTPKNNLPHPVTSFIGREKQIAELEHLLGVTRLLTLTGAGGSGKSRLGAQVAAEQLPKYPDGVWLVELAPLARPALVPQIVAAVVGASEQPGKTLTQTLIEHLGSKRLLLILDNAEHLLGACAELVDAMLRACAQLAVLVTSRERLGIAGEHTYRVPSLAVPDTSDGIDSEQIAAYESARLFVERARLQRPHFAVTAGNAAAIAAICQRLDGIPLAIELAAPRVRSMPVEEVSRRLDQRFSLLTGGSQAALPRHRRLRSLIDWSYDLLSEAEQAVLNQLSVFAGGCSLEAAERVCAGDGFDARDVLDLLASLVDKSLVVADERDGAPRYGLLETVRHYARDRLRDSGEEAHAQHRHLQFFLALAQEAEPRLMGVEQRAWFDRLELENDNLRAALAGSAAAGGDAARGLQLAGALARFWSRRGYLSEGRGWLSKLLETASSTHAETDRAKALGGAGGLAVHVGDLSAADTLFGEALSIQTKLGDRRGMAASLAGLGRAANDRADYAAAKLLLEQSLATGQELQDPNVIALALLHLGILAGHQGDFATAQTMQEKSLALFRATGDQSQIGLLLYNLGTTAFVHGDFPAAQALYEESLAVRRQLGERKTGYLVGALGSLASARGDYRAACALHQQALRIHRELSDRSGLSWSLEGVAFSLAASSPRRAARVWGGAERLREELDAPLPLNVRPEYEQRVATARSALGDDAAFDLAWQEGRAMTLEQTIQCALDDEDDAARGASDADQLASQPHQST